MNEITVGAVYYEKSVLNPGLNSSRELERTFHTIKSSFLGIDSGGLVKSDKLPWVVDFRWLESL